MQDIRFLHAAITIMPMSCVRMTADISRDVVKTNTDIQKINVINKT